MIIMFSSVASLFQRHMEVYIKKILQLFFLSSEKENTRRSGSVSGICSLARKIRSLPSMHHGSTSAPLVDSHQIRPPHSPSGKP